MASLVKFCKIPTQLCRKNGVCLYTSVRNKMNMTYKPAKYPKTEAERRAAAEKYGIPYSQYEPIPDDGHGYGDYPNVPVVSGESRDPYYPWDYPEVKRNYGEAMNINDNMYGEDRYDSSGRLRYPMWVYWTTFIGFMTGLWAIFSFADEYKFIQPRTKKQMPNDGLPHYTFEPLD